MVHDEKFAAQLKEWRYQIHENPEAAFFADYDWLGNAAPEN